MCSKSIETEALFTKTEMDNERIVNFLQNSPVSIQHKCSRGQGSSETSLFISGEAVPLR